MQWKPCKRISRPDYEQRQCKKLFPEFNKLIGPKLIVLKKLSGLNDKEFFQIFKLWLRYTTAKM